MNRNLKNCMDQKRREEERNQRSNNSNVWYNSNNEIMLFLPFDSILINKIAQLTTAIMLTLNNGVQYAQEIPKIII